MGTNLLIPANKKRETELLYPDLSFEVMGLCFAVHNETGKFAKEKQYANALEQKLQKAGLSYQREFVIGNSGNTVDFFIEDKFILELKAKPFLSKSDFVQTQRCLQVTGIKLGILVNFGGTYVRSHRVVRIDYSTRKPTVSD